MLDNYNIQRPVGVIHSLSDDVAVMDEYASNWSFVGGKCILCLKGLVSFDAVGKLAGVTTTKASRMNRRW